MYGRFDGDERGIGKFPCCNESISEAGLELTWPAWSSHLFFSNPDEEWDKN